MSYRAMVILVTLQITSQLIHGEKCWDFIFHPTVFSSWVLEDFDDQSLIFLPGIARDLLILVNGGWCKCFLRISGSPDS